MGLGLNNSSLSEKQRNNIVTIVLCKTMVPSDRQLLQRICTIPVMIIAIYYCTFNSFPTGTRKCVIFYLNFSPRVLYWIKRVMEQRAHLCLRILCTLLSPVW